MEIFALVCCLIAAVAYSGEMVAQERKLPTISPIVVTFLIGMAIFLYGLPVLLTEAAVSQQKWPKERSLLPPTSATKGKPACC